MILVFNNFNFGIHFLFLNLILLFLLIEYFANNSLSFNINGKHLAFFFKVFSVMIYFLLVFFSLTHNSSNIVCFEFDCEFPSSLSYIKSDIFSAGSTADSFYGLIVIIHFSSSSFSSFPSISG